MRVIKDKFGCLLPYNDNLAKRPDCTVIESYTPGKPIKVGKMKRVKKPTPAPVVDVDDLPEAEDAPDLESELEALGGLDS